MHSLTRGSEERWALRLYPESVTGVTEDKLLSWVVFRARADALHMRSNGSATTMNAGHSSPIC